MSDQTREKPLVLAVDDAPENIDVIKGLLTPEYTVSAAINGSLALKIAENQQPDLILLDVMMPEMDGFEVYRRLRAGEASRDIPVIFLTAVGADESLPEDLDAEEISILNKPISPGLLKEKIALHIKQG